MTLLAVSLITSHYSWLVTWTFITRIEQEMLLLKLSSYYGEIDVVIDYPEVN